MANPTWDGIDIDWDQLQGYGWNNVKVTVNSVQYPLLQGYMVAGLREMDARISGTGGTLVATSATSAAIGTGAKTLTVETGKGFSAGMYVIAYQTAAPANYMIGLVTAYDTATGDLDFTVAAGDTGGSGTISAWTVAITGRKGATGADGDVVGPVSSTANGLARFDGTAGNALKNSGWTLSDAETMTAAGTLAMAGQQISDPLLVGARLGITAFGTLSTGTTTVGPNWGNVSTFTIGGNMTWNFSAPASGQTYGHQIFVTQGGAGGFTPTFQYAGNPADVMWRTAEPDWASMAAGVMVEVQAQMINGKAYLKAEIVEAA